MSIFVTMIAKYQNIDCLTIHFVVFRYPYFRVLHDSYSQRSETASSLVEYMYNYPHYLHVGYITASVNHNTKS